MTEVMDPDGREASGLSDPFDLIEQIAFGKVKQALIWIRLIKGLEVLYRLIIQKQGDRNTADAGVRFGSEDICGSSHHLIVFIDVQPILINAAADKVISGKGQQFPLPDSGPEQDIEGQPASGLFFISEELLKLVKSLDLHGVGV